MKGPENYRELFRFVVVGLSGVFVNLATMIALTWAGPHPEAAVLALVPTDYHVRWYHVYSLAAFFVANLWNFQINRSWTFRSQGRWGREYRDFLIIGIITQGVGLIVLTLFMHPASPVSLSPEFFDDSSFPLTRVYWAQLFTIAVVTPISFLANKLWTFRHQEEPAR